MTRTGAASLAGSSLSPSCAWTAVNREGAELSVAGASSEADAGRGEPGPLEDLLLRHAEGPLHKSKQRDVGSAEAIAGRVVNVGVAVGGGGTSGPDGGDFERRGRSLPMHQFDGEEQQEQ